MEADGSVTGQLADAAQDLCTELAALYARAQNRDQQIALARAYHSAQALADGLAAAVAVA